MEYYELSASVALWRGRELLLMKRASGFSSGGWFLPGGHVEASERPSQAAVRELFEETGIGVEAAALDVADVMSYERDGASAHSIVFNALCPPGAEPVLNDEHVVARWYEPEAAIARFFDGDTLRGKGLDERAITLAEEVARVIRAAVRARGAAGASEKEAVAL